MVSSYHRDDLAFEPVMPTAMQPMELNAKPSQLPNTGNYSSHGDNDAVAEFNQTIVMRSATWSDLVPAAKVLSQAFVDSDTLGKLIHPYRDAYPEDTYLYWLRRFQGQWWDPRITVMLLIQLESETPIRPDESQHEEHEPTERGAGVNTATTEEKIVGVAQWTRRGTDPQARIRWDAPWWDLRPTIAQYLCTWYVKTTTYLFPSRAVDPRSANILAEARTHFAHHWSGARSSVMHLNWLGILPEYQNRGFGQRLVQWGLDRAEAEGVGASVLAADQKAEWYRRRGFNTCVGSSSEGEGNPLNGVPGGEILFRDPKDANEEQ